MGAAPSWEGYRPCQGGSVLGEHWSPCHSLGQAELVGWRGSRSSSAVAPAAAQGCSLHPRVPAPTVRGQGQGSAGALGSQPRRVRRSTASTSCVMGQEVARGPVHACLGHS